MDHEVAVFLMGKSYALHVIDTIISVAFVHNVDSSIYVGIVVCSLQEQNNIYGLPADGTRVQNDAVLTFLQPHLYAS